MPTRVLRTILAMVAFLTVVTPASAQERDYAAGQVWAYQSAVGDEGSRIIIQEVDQIGPEDDPMVVYHISMTGVHVPGWSEPLDVPHLPVLRETLDKSVIALASSDAGPFDYLEGKKIWAANNGGVFTITLAEIADFLRNLMISQTQPEP